MTKYFIFITIMLLSLTACEKFDFMNLKRDNPLDEKNDANKKGGVYLVFNDVYVYSDNNGDKIINKGETVKLNISLKNMGISNAYGVKATFSTNSPYISKFTSTTQLSYGYIGAGDYEWYGNAYQYSYYAVQFVVSDSAPADAKIPINIDMVDENGNTWTDSFNITVFATGANIVFNEFYVYSDNNGDKIINKGETIKLNVSLKNKGTSKANGVKATFSTNSPYISNFSPSTQLSFGNIGAGDYEWYGNAYQYSYYAIQFKVQDRAPANTQIPINANIVDESGNSWTTSFNVTISATGANIVFNEFYVYSDSNGDKIINKGETIKLNVSLKNIGTSKANGVKATFSTNSPYISNFSPITQLSFGNIGAGDYEWYGNAYQYSYYAVQFVVSSSTPTNTQIPIYINIVDECNNTWNSSFNIVIH